LRGEPLKLPFPAQLTCKSKPNYAKLTLLQKTNVERSKERESKHVVIVETKGIMLGIHHTQAKNGNVDALQPQVQNCYQSFPLCRSFVGLK
jgi:hypothetical protein